MEKVARIVSVEFDSKQNKVESMAKFRSNINDLAAVIELSVVLNMDENSIIAIQIWPDQATLDAYEEKRTEWFSDNIEVHVRDRIAHEGDVDFWFQQIKYFGADAINVSGAGAELHLTPSCDNYCHQWWCGIRLAQISV